MAVEDDERFAVCDLEAHRDGLSYTVDTLEELHSQMPDSEFFLIVGADVAAGFAEWREADRVVKLATLALAVRPGTTRAVVRRALRRLDAGARARSFDIPAIW